jgi:hypothetical protein
MRHISVYLVGLVGLGAVALAAGCGGGGKTGTTATKAATVAPATSRAATTTTAASAFSALASAKNCKQLADLSAKFSDAMAGTASASDLKREAQLLREFAAKTPSEIRADFQVVAEDFGKIADAVGGMKQGTVPDAATLAKLGKLSSEIDSTKLTQASQHISSWLLKNCS